MPMGLPPSRAHELPITLKEGLIQLAWGHIYTGPKDEIEALIHDMLKAGIMQHSNNVFSSPIILVKKKDASWRFCGDYRALNKVNMTNKYPISIIDILLDELHGARVFTKLDSKSGYH